MSGLARAATTVSLAFVASRALGVLREVIIAQQFGTSPELDAYRAAFVIPDTIYLLIAGGALASAFIPTFAGFLARADEAGGRAPTPNHPERVEGSAWESGERLASTIINSVFLFLASISLVVALLAPWLVTNVLVPDFSPEQQALTTMLLRIMLISTTIFGVSGIAMSILNARQHFLLPALAPIVYNLAIIAGALLLGPRIGVMGLTVGIVAGALAHLLVQVPALVRYGFHWQPALALGNAHVREVARLMGPRVFGLAITQLNFFINARLASGLAAGSLAALYYAWTIMLLPEGVVAQALATAIFPTFAAQSARGELAQMRATFATAMRSLLFLILPATVGLFVARGPIISVLLQRGRFDATSTELTAFALQFYALGLVAHSALEIITRAFYALHDTRTPVAVGAAAMALNVVLSLLLIQRLSFGGLALANTVATTLEVSSLFLLLRRRMGGVNGSMLAPAAARMTLAALLMGVCLYAFLSLAGGLSIWLVAAGALAVGAVSYFGASWLAGVPEVARVPQFLLGRAKV